MELSKYTIKITKTDYIPEGNYMKETEVFKQEFTDDDAVRRVAIAINSKDYWAIETIDES